MMRQFSTFIRRALRRRLTTALKRVALVRCYDDGSWGVPTITMDTSGVRWRTATPGSREDMLVKVAVYPTNDLIGTDSTYAQLTSTPLCPCTSDP